MATAMTRIATEEMAIVVMATMALITLVTTIPVQDTTQAVIKALGMALDMAMDP